LSWVAESAPTPALKDVARLRLASLLWETKALDEALKQLGSSFTPEMSGLAADLRGDVLQAKGQTPEAVAAYQQAWKQMPDNSDYRRMVQAKLSALGVQVSSDTATETAK
jgi:predicted negative regulator of RcsB-dependent stress response